MNTKTLFTTMALTGALIASTTVAKANAYLELTSGSHTSHVTSSSSLGLLTFTGAVGSWTANVTTGNATLAPLALDVGTTSSGASINHALEIIYSTGSYDALGAFNLNTSSSSSPASMKITTAAYSGPALYTGGSLAGMTLLAPIATFGAHGSSDQNGTLASPLDYYSEIITISFASYPVATVSASLDSQFILTPPRLVPDGGMTMIMLGSALAGLTIFRSKLGAKSA